MNNKDKQMLDLLVKDKSKRYELKLNKDSVCIKDNFNNKIIHTFSEKGYNLVDKVFKYLKLN